MVILTIFGGLAGYLFWANNQMHKHGIHAELDKKKKKKKEKWDIDWFNKFNEIHTKIYDSIKLLDPCLYQENINFTNLTPRRIRKRKHI